ncbi:hypothetical protein HDU78_005341 [Chytriomyces hyalinus]|nr:hypothetical protein HDU78_005341 [Chytriomyces hyalinus]
MNQHSPCFTAVDTWISPQSMTLNVTFASEREMMDQKYHLRFTFPTWFIMGPQPYRAPFGTVTCKPAVLISSTLQTMDCYSKEAPLFFAVFLMNTNGALPSAYTQMALVNNDRSLTACELKQWCAPIVSEGAGGTTDGSTKIPDGYVQLPLIGPQPAWVVTVIFSSLGILLGAVVFAYVRASQDSLPSHLVFTANNTPSTSPKGSDGFIAAPSPTSPSSNPQPMTLMQKAELMKVQNQQRGGGR